MRARRPFNRIRTHFGREEGGQVLVLTALACVSIIGIAAFVVDVGSWWQVSRQAQAAADAGATAAATDLPASASQAVTDAQTYVNKNISGATTTTVTPFNSDSSQVKVTVTTTAPTFFAKIFGFNSVTVTESAVAKRVTGGSKYAMFANSTACGNTITNPGSSISIGGSVWSNGGLTLPGTGNSYGTTTYGGPNHCSASPGSGNTFNGSSTPTQGTTSIPWPEPFFTSAPGAGVCTFSGTSYNWTTNGTAASHYVIPSGTYCATSSISINSHYADCHCTFIAPSVALPGANITMTPYYSDLIIDNYTGNFNIAGSGDSLTIAGAETLKR
jgi:Flp pilus assembly protein TadG